MNSPPPEVGGFLGTLGGCSRGHAAAAGDVLLR